MGVPILKFIFVGPGFTVYRTVGIGISIGIVANAGGLIVYSKLPIVESKPITTGLGFTIEVRLGVIPTRFMTTEGGLISYTSYPCSPKRTLPNILFIITHKLCN